MYDLGVFDDDFSFVGSLNHSSFCEDILSNSSNTFRLLPTDRELSIVSLSAVEKNQANDYNFLAITQSGIRVYYTLKKKQRTDKKG